ncbi:Na+/H+ antiporter NhaC, partial [Butyricicoccus sp. 1XD8-22]
ESVLLVVAIIFIISISISKFGATPHIPIIFSIFLLITYGLLKKVPFADLQSSMSAGASAGMGAVYIFILIGLLISGWIIGGTIPTLLYYGFSFVSPSFFFAIVFIVTGIIGIVIGSSLTTVATVGVAFIGIASALDISIAITAGAIVSGAFFGDKMSPLSDTTTLAAGTVNVDLFEHIKNMGWTTIPAFIITLIFYAALSPSIEVIDTSIINEYKTGLLTTNLVHGYALLPLIILIACTLFKIPAFITLA